MIISDGELIIAVSLAIASVAVTIGSGRSDPPVDCVIDRQALEIGEPDQWADWPVCLEPERDIYICVIDTPAGGAQYIPYCADEIGASHPPSAGT